MLTLSASVAQAWAMLARHLGSRFTLAELLDLISASRGKPIEVVELALPIGTDGGVLPLRDCDIIATRTGQDHILTLGSQLHECAHVVLGHVPLYVNGTPDATPTWATIHTALGELDATYLRSLVVQRSHTTAYDVPEEADAEALASLLMDALDRSQQAVPLTVQALYGYYENDQ